MNFKITKSLLIILLSYFSCSAIFSQPSRQETRDMVNAERIAFITKEISLTSDEAQKLWPIMNEAEQKRDVLRKERNKIRKNIELLSSKVSETEYENTLNFESQFHMKEAEIFKERQLKLKKIFSSKRIVELYRAEDEFKKWLIKNVKNSK
ncbi:MAG: hypothetical protein ACK5D5_10465 [Bacteroidota bacterium]|jgi:Spy/CpxP family protein refolding chaperone